MRYILKNTLILGWLSLMLISCSTQINEPVKVEKYNYELSKTEAKVQAEILLDETITVLIETIKKRTTASKTEFEAIKKSSNNNNFYSDGWYIWQNKIYADPFGKNNTYNGIYLSKIRFNNAKPEKADTTRSVFNVHTKFGFLNNSIYGDEVDFSITSLLLSFTNNIIPIKTNAEYKRRWIANYDGVDSELKYLVNIESKNLKYHSNINIEWFEGLMVISFSNFTFNITMKKGTLANIKFYRNNNLINDYNFELSALKFAKSLQKNNRDIFPGYSIVNDKFINLLQNFPSAGSPIELTF